MSDSIFYSGAPLDRRFKQRKNPQLIEESIKNDNIQLVCFKELKAEVIYTNKTPKAVWHKGNAASKIIKNANMCIFLGVYKNCMYFAANITTNNHDVSISKSFEEIRTFAILGDPIEASILGYARGILYWHQKVNFCGVCGSLTKTNDSGHSRICQNIKCKQIIFPRLDPAVIMLVTYKKFCLLGRQYSWPKGMHSTLAGFVEHGESIEEAVAREVFEEVGLTVNSPIYCYSQPWPFPRSLMLGFKAEATSDQIIIDDNELENALWLTKQEIINSPENETFKLPGKLSIARRLINDWLG